MSYQNKMLQSNVTSQEFFSSISAEAAIVWQCNIRRSSGAADQCDVTKGGNTSSWRPDAAGQRYDPVGRQTE